MALIKCPECRREVSDTAGSCPHCGFKIQIEKLKDFVPVKTTLVFSKPQNADVTKASVLLFFGIPILLCGFIYGLFPLLVGFVLTSVGLGNLFGYQEGDCPYCGHRIRMKRDAFLNQGVRSIRCGHCNNVMRKTKAELFSTHPIEDESKADNEE